jgi:hypothetical protein
MKRIQHFKKLIRQNRRNRIPWIEQRTFPSILTQPSLKWLEKWSEDKIPQQPN